MLGSTSFFAILLALSYFFNTAQGIPFFGSQVYGYATVDKYMATRINKLNKLYYKRPSVTFDTTRLGPSFDTQLGPGFNIIQEPGPWVNKDAGDWYCAIKANKRKMKSISKVYIQSLYWGEDELILSLVKGLVPQPEKALRISWVQGTDRLQMLIPKKLIEESDDLDLWAKCFESEDELKRFSDKALNWPGEKRWEIMGNIGESNVAAVEGRMA